MSRPCITSIHALSGIIGAHRQQALETGVRHLVLLRLPAGVSAPSGSLHSDGRSRATTVDPSDRVVGWLGSDQDHVVFSTDRSWRLTELAAALGTVRAGGLVVVIVTSAALHNSVLLKRLADSVRTRVRKHPRASLEMPFASAYSVAITHWERVFLKAPWRAVPSAFRKTTSSARLPRRSDDIPALGISDQTVMFERAQQHLSRARTGATPALIVVTGPRGSGKSALLGRLHARLSGTDQNVIVTGPAARSTQNLFKHGGSGAFTSLDMALKAEPGVVVIDEAASVPGHRLKGLVSHHHHAIVATTTEGYESAGRAFDVRTVSMLATPTTDVLRLKTAHAMRWRSGDPLQTMITDAFLLEQTQAAKSTSFVDPSSTARVRRIHRDVLRRDMTTTRALIDLLNSTHYQSSLATTDDVLSGRIQTWVIERGDALLGAVAAVEEPSLTQDLHEDILANRRRIHDRLLPQLLARSIDNAGPLQHDFHRIVRIAIRPEVRRQGLGTRLIEALIHDDTGPRSIGAVFADEPGASAFWDKLGFSRFHLGQRVNPRSGNRSAAVLRTEEPSVSGNLATAIEIFQDNCSPRRKAHDPGRDQALLKRLVLGQRRLAETRGPVHRLWLAQPGVSAALSDDWGTVPGVSDAATRKQRERAVIAWVKAHV